ncbi:MAG: hypothetical protein QM723_16630 [Myxococcaceae bacterium]
MSTHHSVHEVARSYSDAATQPMTLGAPMEPESAPGKNPLQKMSSIMHDQLRRLTFYRQLHGHAPQGERARAVTMLRVAMRFNDLWGFDGGPSSRDLFAFGKACAALREDLIR